MKLVPIFARTKHTLLAIQFEDEVVDEFTKAFRQWNDIAYLRSFFKTHENDLINGFYTWPDSQTAVFHTLTLAQELEDLVFNKANGRAHEISDMLQDIFKPLNNVELNVRELQKSKTSKQWLRLYAIRISRQCYIITGSAIKLVKLMNEWEHLKKELHKLERVKQYLIEIGLLDEWDVEFLELKR